MPCSRPNLACTAAITALLSMAGVAVAQSDANTAESEATMAPATSSPWRLEFNTWIWIMGLNGDVGIGDRTSEVDASFGDILEESDSIFAFSGRLEVGYERFGVFVDGLYSDLGVENASGPAGISSIDVTLQQGIIDFGAMYRLIDNEPQGNAAQNRRNFTLDLYAGGRYNTVTLELDPRNLSSRSMTEDWVDPIIGAKVVVPLAADWHIAVNGDVGGFGVSSDLTWSATVVIGYDFSLFDIPSTAMVGYRAIGWDYESDDDQDFKWDIVQHGIIIGFAMHF